ncbi:MAG TPA: hypothetical protein VHQ46_02300 [Desulfobacteria bacterium]|nr:hypothetical protein [Desulfobacteria bacterium]
MGKNLWHQALSFLSFLFAPAKPDVADNPDQSIYWIDDGQKTYLADRNPEVAAVRKLCDEFAARLNNRDYTNLDGKAEYHLYTVDHIKELLKQKDEKRTLKHYKGNKLTTKYEGCQFVSIVFNRVLDHAEAIFNVHFRIVTAADKYLNSLGCGNNKFSLGNGIPVEQLYKLTLHKPQGMWKISSFEADSEINVLK